MQTPPGQTPLPAQCMLGYGQQAGSMHAIEIHACLTLVLIFHNLAENTF